MGWLSKIKIFWGFFVILIAIVIIFFSKSNPFIIEKIEVSILEDQEKTASYFKLKKLIERKMKPYRSASFWELPLSEIDDWLKAEKRIKRYHVERAFPSKIRLRILPERPVFYLFSSKSKWIPVTENGEYLNAVPAGELEDVPILRGRHWQEESDQLMKVIGFFIKLPAEGLLSKTTVSDFSYGLKSGYKLNLTSEPAPIHLGHELSVEKANKIAKVLEYMRVNNIQGRVIDARYTKKVVVRPRNDL